MMSLKEYNTLKSDLANYEQSARTAMKCGLVAHTNTYVMIKILREKLAAVEGAILVIPEKVK